MLAKLPKELEGLREPKFVLMPPVGVQYGFLSVTLVLSVSVLLWLAYRVATHDDITLVDGFAGFIMLLAFLATSYPAHWRRWATFACDRHGIYLRKSDLGYLFKPWQEVGGFHCGTVRSYDDRYESVIVRVRLSEDEWETLVGKHPHRPLDELGFSDFGIGQQVRTPAKTLESIERVWILSGKKGYSS